MINVVVERKEPEEPQYPCLMIAKKDKSGLIALFTGDNCGTILDKGIDNYHYRIGDTSEEWIMSEFELFTDKLVLKNK